jgi:chemotaxis protein MotB
MGRGRKAKQEGGGVPEWVVTFADMMSLLLTFFILLLSFSTISEEDFQRAVMSLQGAFGVLSYMQTEIQPISEMPRVNRSAMDRAARRLRRQLQIRGQEKDVKIEFDATGGLKIVLPTAILFGSASADLMPAAAPVLADVADVLKSLPEVFIEVRGHTDSRPMTSSGAFRDNYDLSYFRADAVARRLHDTGQIPMQQFEVVACGDSQPVATNETEEGRAANRRVEIYVRGVLDNQQVEGLRSEFESVEGVATENRTPRVWPGPEF